MRSFHWIMDMFQLLLSPIHLWNIIGPVEALSHWIISQSETVCLIEICLGSVK
jgi:hypothetical protein